MTDNTNELAALIVRNIVDLEEAMAFAHEVVEERLCREVYTILDRQLGQVDWYYKDRADLNGWFCPRDWLVKGMKKPDANQWFEICTPGEDGAETWLATFAGGQPEQNTAAINLYTARPRQWRQVIADHPAAVAQLQDAGFKVAGEQIYFPLALDREQLAQGFADNDLTEALVPVEAARSPWRQRCPRSPCWSRRTPKRSGEEKILRRTGSYHSRS